MYMIIVEEANTRGPESPIEIEEVNSLDKALAIVNKFAEQYLSDPDNQCIIKLMPTSIF
ncbi:hypothetical protein LCGC14_2613220 [marine sediment metagenome]|uniref:Uncharacterized protein n=1 Tax=marine sediment metagenome TaxID=412755 RepID=A0A0F9A5B2_9ZZZZ